MCPRADLSVHRCVSLISTASASPTVSTMQQTRRKGAKGRSLTREARPQCPRAAANRKKKRKREKTRGAKVVKSREHHPKHRGGSQAAFPAHALAILPCQCRIETASDLDAARRGAGLEANQEEIGIVVAGRGQKTKRKKRLTASFDAATRTEEARCCCCGCPNCAGLADGAERMATAAPRPRTLSEAMAFA